MLRKVAVVRRVFSGAPGQRSRAWDRLSPVAAGTLLVMALYVALVAAGQLDVGRDALVWYTHKLPDPYDTSYLGYGFAYSPAFARVVYPLTLLPWAIVAALVSAVLLGCVYWLAGPWSLIALGLVPWAMLDLTYGNINILLVVAVLAGLRWPTLWAFPLLTR